MQRPPISLRQAAFLAGIIFIFFVLMNFNARLEQRDALRQRARQSSAQATQVIQTNMALEAKLEYATSDQALQDWAYRDGHMYLPGDQRVVPMEVINSTPIQSESPPATPTPMQNWEIWHSIFFGE